MDGIAKANISQKLVSGYFNIRFSYFVDAPELIFMVLTFECLGDSFEI